MRRAIGILPLLACMALAPPIVARPPAPGYFDILSLYRSGEFDRAVASLQRMPLTVLEGVPQALSTAGDDRLRSAALLHLEVAMSARQRRDRDGWTRHESIGRGAVILLEQIDRRGAFPRAWRLLVIAFLEGDGDLLSAVQAADEARAAGGDTPLLMLSVGAAHEMSWTWKQDGETESPLKGKLGTAVSLYKRALTGDPTLLEARVRLGRTLRLQGDVDEALATLAGVSPPHEVGYVYLARLFEGEALETTGDLARAERAYELASRLMPRSQSAQIALSHLQHLQGRRPDAAARIRATTAAPERLETTDAWYWYTRGMAWRVDPYLATLRHMVTAR